MRLREIFRDSLGNQHEGAMPMHAGATTLRSSMEDKTFHYNDIDMVDMGNTSEKNRENKNDDDTSSPRSPQALSCSSSPPSATAHRCSATPTTCRTI